MNKILYISILIFILFFANNTFAQTRPGAQPINPGNTDPAGQVPGQVTRPGAQPAPPDGERRPGQGVNRPGAVQEAIEYKEEIPGCNPDRPECTVSKPQPCAQGPGIMTAIGCIPTEPQALVNGLLRYGTFAAGGIAFLLMILAALQMITAEGNPEAIKHGQERFYSAIIGLLLIIFSVLLMQVIGVDILDLPGFER